MRGEIFISPLFIFELFDSPVNYLWIKQRFLSYFEIILV